MKIIYCTPSSIILFAVYGVTSSVLQVDVTHEGSTPMSKNVGEKIVQIHHHEHHNLVSFSTTNTLPWQQRMDKDKYLPPPCLTIDFNNRTTLFNNTPGQIVLQNQHEPRAFRFIISCKAPYPVRLVYEANELGDVTGPIVENFGSKILTNDHYFNLTYDFRYNATYVFHVHHKFKFVAVVNDLTFTCQAITNPCLRRTAQFSFLDRNPNHVKITLNHGTDVCPSSSSTPSTHDILLPTPPPVVQPRSKNVSNSEGVCDAIFFYEKILDDGTPHYVFRCLFTEDGRPGEVKRFECATKPKCRNILDKGREQKGCWRRFDKDPKNLCANCEPDTKALTFNAFVSICTRGNFELRPSSAYRKTQIGSLGFYGVVQEGEKIPNIFFSDDDVDPQEMISLTGFSSDQIINGSVKAHCQLSGYYASATFQFALEIEGEKELHLLKPPTNEHGDWIRNRTSWNSWLGAWEQDMVINLENPKIKRIYCFGGIQDSHAWLNASIPIKFLLDGQSFGDDEKILLNKILLVSTLFIMVGMGAGAIVRQRRHRNQNFRELTDCETSLFLEGDLNNLNVQSSFIPSSLNPDDDDDPPPVYCLPYNRRFEVPRHRIQLNKSKVLGFGEFGVVMEGWVLPPQQFEEGGGLVGEVKVGVKMVQCSVTSVGKFLAFLNEIKVMAYLDHHPNIVSLVAACTESMKKRKAMAALEYCEHGDLLSYLQVRRHFYRNLFLPPTITTKYVTTTTSYCNEDVQASVNNNLTPYIKFEPMSTLDLLKFAVGVVNGMKYLSQKKVVHGDLALRNILVTGGMEAKISDFGLSSLLLQNSNYVTTPEGNIPWKWTALEALPSGRLSIHADVWSFGILLWEIFSLGQDPYPGQMYCGFVDKLRSGYRMDRPPYANDKLSEIMLECWTENRHERPSFSDLHGRLLDLMIRLDCGQNYFDP